MTHPQRFRPVDQHQFVFFQAAMERRNDPHDGKTQTLQEMLQKYKGIYSKGEIEAYFKDECTAVPKMTASACSAEIPGLRQ